VNVTVQFSTSRWPLHEPLLVTMNVQIPDQMENMNAVLTSNNLNVNVCSIIVA
jgi:hypothetical protein